MNRVTPSGCNAWDLSAWGPMPPVIPARCGGLIASTSTDEGVSWMWLMTGLSSCDPNRDRCRLRHLLASRQEHRLSAMTMCVAQVSRFAVGADAHAASHSSAASPRGRARSWACSRRSMRSRPTRVAKVASLAPRSQPTPTHLRRWSSTSEGTFVGPALRWRPRRRRAAETRRASSASCQFSPPVAGVTLAGRRPVASRTRRSVRSMIGILAIQATTPIDHARTTQIVTDSLASAPSTRTR
ncbi:hypothetical protein Afer_0502 [Acidimicrobium ferrooxidans DSM 10331]|uniref:Uncharacterized protein n=1 Tax=Acidimicrobium ferrooxidans (strain DSM 10331 / JCM 15462 / NBRC 103882 / ICP) TaxID=525909 RepID=C7M375_ACIFD|nr:hypothetical protein Afer_0502 [Acidimicrobium ferrooxidans DSM 10331]